MEIILEHPFFTNYKDSLTLFSNTYKLGTFISRITRIAEKISKNPSSVSFLSTKQVSQDIANDFRGQSFEAFVELFIKILGCNSQIGISEYHPCFSLDKKYEDDYGVDGFGVGKNGKVITVQCKFRGEYDKTLFSKQDHLDNFVRESLSDRFNVDKNDDSNMLVITTGDGIFYKDMKVEWKDKVRYISRSTSWGCFKHQKYSPNHDVCRTASLESMVNDNYCFWSTVTKLIQKC
jgi:hypothetical protein